MHKRHDGRLQCSAACALLVLRPVRSCKPYYDMLLASASLMDPLFPSLDLASLMRLESWMLPHALRTKSGAGPTAVRAATPPAPPPVAPPVAPPTCAPLTKLAGLAVSLTLPSKNIPMSPFSPAAQHRPSTPAEPSAACIPGPSNYVTAAAAVAAAARASSVTSWLEGWARLAEQPEALIAANCPELPVPPANGALKGSPAKAAAPAAAHNGSSTAAAPRAIPSAPASRKRGREQQQAQAATRPAARTAAWAPRLAHASTSFAVYQTRSPMKQRHSGMEGPAPAP